MARAFDVDGKSRCANRLIGVEGRDRSVRRSNTTMRTVLDGVGPGHHTLIVDRVHGGIGRARRIDLLGLSIRRSNEATPTPRVRRNNEAVVGRIGVDLTEFAPYRHRIRTTCSPYRHRIASTLTASESSRSADHSCLVALA